ncbi:MFS transporter [Geodermatophilus sp. CPCC 205761]|uniref:MFS transporter n=1 Tax=Geodermatophilus sp. CPCC 205761 TaxID=2936597 RepID=UPI003EEDC8B8
MPSRRLRPTAAFWSAATLLVLVLAASGVPSPLYRVYQERFGFSAGVLTTVFGIYAIALLAALLVVGRLSDHVGRRPVLVVGLLLQVVSGVLFLAADGVGWLLVARVVQGLSVGTLTGTLGAMLLDLQRRDRPLAAMLNSASPTIGLSIGAVGAGVLVEYTGEPTRWVFAPLVLAFLVATAAVAVLPETSPRIPGSLASLRPQVGVPRAHRAPFLVALPCLVATWALGGLYLSLGPSLAVGVFGVEGHLVGSLLILAMQGSGAIGSISMWQVLPHRSMLTGALLFAVGVGITITALATGSLTLFFVASAVSGFGFGVGFLGALGTITAGVAPSDRAGLLSSVYVAGYLAFSVPAVVAGIAVGHVGLRQTAEVYGAVLIVLTLIAVAGLLRRRRVVRQETAVEQAEPVAA